MSLTHQKAQNRLCEGLDKRSGMCYYYKAAYYGQFKESASSALCSEPKYQVGANMYAVIETGGKQYKVANGDVVYVEKLEAENDTTVEFKVVAVSTDAGFKVGAPYVEGAKVTGKVLKTAKGKKITVFTYKPKKSEKRKMGHRQFYTKVQIESIES